MRITDDVIADLLPLYTAGEASPDTRALVEEYLAANPALADVVKAASDERVQPIVDVPRESTERVALNRSRALLRRRSWIMGLAIFSTLLPFSVGSFDGADRDVTFFMLRDAPAVAASFAAVAVVLWTVYYRLNQRLRSTGL